MKTPRIFTAITLVFAVLAIANAQEVNIQAPIWVNPIQQSSDENIDGHILFGMTGKLCRTTIAGGKLLMKDRELIGIDEEAENAHILEAAKKLWGELNHRTY